MEDKSEWYLNGKLHRKDGPAIIYQDGCAAVVYNNKNINLLTFFIYLIIFRYLFLFIYGYINVHDNIIHINDVRYFSEEFLIIITLKGIIDIFLMSFIGSILFLISKKFIYQFKFR